MYGFFSSSPNSTPVQSTASPQSIQSSQSQASPSPAQIFFTVPPQGPAASEPATQRPSYTLYNVTSGLQQQQRQQSVNYVASTDPSWSSVRHFYGSAVPLTASPMKMVVQAPSQEAGCEGAEHSSASLPYHTTPVSSSSLAALSHHVQISPSTAPTAVSYAAFPGSDPYLGYQLATTAATFTPLILTGVGDSRRTSLNVYEPHYIDNAANSSAFYQSQSNRTVTQLPQQQQQQHFQGTTPSHFALQTLQGHTQPTLPSIPAAAVNARSTVQAVFIEEPTAQHGVQHFLQQVGHVQRAMAPPMHPAAVPTTTTTNTTAHQHFDPAVDREARHFSQGYLHGAPFGFAAPQQSHVLSSVQQQQFYSPYTHVQEHARHVSAHTDRIHSSLSRPNERPPVCSVTGGPAPYRRRPPTTPTPLSSAAVSSGAKDSPSPPYPPQRRCSIPAAAAVEQASPPHPEEQKRHPQQQRDQPLSTVNASINTNTTVASPPPPPSSPDAAQSSSSPPQTPSRSIVRRNCDKAVLFVGQLNYEATEADVVQIFSCYGKPLSVVVLKDKGKSSRRGSAAAAASGAAQRKVGGSAFVNYSSTLEADTAIMALHDRYNAKDDDPDNDADAKYLQVSYGQQTGLISTFGMMHAEMLHALKPENPIPLIVLERRKASATTAKPEEFSKEKSESDS